MGVTSSLQRCKFVTPRLLCPISRPFTDMAIALSLSAAHPILSRRLGTAAFASIGATACAHEREIRSSRLYPVKARAAGPPPLPPPTLFRTHMSCRQLPLATFRLGHTPWRQQLRITAGSGQRHPATTVRLPLPPADAAACPARTPHLPTCASSLHTSACAQGGCCPTTRGASTWPTFNACWMPWQLRLRRGALWSGGS